MAQELEVSRIIVINKILFIHFSMKINPYKLCVIDTSESSVTEIKVRMDCNGCVHKIKKALHNIDGIYDVFTDYPQQKVTVVGRADPEKILKAIKKTRKVATICSHVEPVDQPLNPIPATEEQPAAPDTTNNPRVNLHQQRLHQQNPYQQLSLPKKNHLRSRARLPRQLRRLQPVKPLRQAIL
ncbi:hypothetical protein QJS10_CPB17g01197 [Acorus calamus]|uniref:HMA domain-containing protein n=1 Tax=Acorus calamus TaxID=4465 RepID=A0AAV9CXY4_ACOCL|nr:hypothetical protein QJS10_CPB17g01197 [Acorus calamus]